MKKTAKIIHLINYIEDMELSRDELERLISEIEDLPTIEHTITQTELDEEKQSYINNQ